MAAPYYYDRFRHDYAITLHLFITDTLADSLLFIIFVAY